MPADIERALQAGFAAYLTKPLDLSELLHAVQQHLRGR
jgi:CheY-like chemotaxis protein